MEKYTLSVLVDNHAGVLVRVASLFSRRGFNIDSLVVGTTQDKHLSRITVITSCDQRELDQLVSQLEKLVCVKTIQVLPPSKSVSRELLLIKVAVDQTKRGELMSTASAFNARVVDVTKNSLTFELTGDTPKINALMALLADYGILESMRTGAVALERDTNTIYNTL